MQDKFVKLLEEGQKEEQLIEKTCSCKKPCKSKKKCDHDCDCKAVKEGLVSEEKGKRGRPKNDDVDDSGKEGVRDVTLVATIKINGEKETKEKTFKDLDTKDIDKKKDEWEKKLHKEYDYDADDIKIKVKIGDFDASSDAEEHMSKKDDGSDAEDEAFDIGTK